MRRVLPALLFVLLLTGVARAHPVALGVYASKTQVEITEPFAYQIVLEFPGGWSVTPPVMKREMGLFDVDGCSTQIDQHPDGGARLAISCTLTSYEPGVIDLPVKEVKINGPNGHVETDLLPEVKLTVVGPLVGEEPRGLKPPEEVPTNWLTLVLGGGVGLIVVALIVLTVVLLVRWVRGREKREKAAPREPADLRALRRLDSEELERLLREGKAKPFYTELTAIVREYLEARFGLPAPDRTSHEILDLLKFYGLTDHQKFFRELLDNSDYAKFAGLEVPHDLWLRHRSQSRMFVVNTKPEEMPEPAPDDATDKEVK
ncbi:MAG TPA: hypothetical protein PKW95_20990 [bacterium]|nr:hypothetical protein [bacterium]